MLGSLAMVTMLIIQLFANWWQTCIVVGCFYALGMLIVYFLRQVPSVVGEEDGYLPQVSAHEAAVNESSETPLEVVNTSSEQLSETAIQCPVKSHSDGH